MERIVRRVLHVVMTLLIFGGILGTACARRETPRGREVVVVTTSWLECVVADVCPGEFEVVRLSPPGGCPGHFDMTPSQMSAVRGSRFLVRFDFQQGLDDEAAPAGKGPTVVRISPGDGMCIPENYLRSCRDMARAICASRPELRGPCDLALAEIERRMNGLAAELQGDARKAGLAGKRVIASRHQAAFCRWLGLEVSDVFGADDADNPQATARILANAGAGRVACVVANLQEGDRQARALAGRLEAPVAVLGNFPDMTDAQRTFDGLLRANVRQLAKAARP